MRFKLYIVHLDIGKGAIMTLVFIHVLDVVLDAFCASSHLFLKAVIGRRYNDVCNCLETGPKER